MCQILKIHKVAFLLRLLSLKIRHNASHLIQRIKMKFLSTYYQIFIRNALVVWNPVVWKSSRTDNLWPGFPFEYIFSFKWYSPPSLLSLPFLTPYTGYCFACQSPSRAFLQEPISYLTIIALPWHSPCDEMLRLVAFATTYLSFSQYIILFWKGENEERDMETLVQYSKLKLPTIFQNVYTPIFKRTER